MSLSVTISNRVPQARREVRAKVDLATRKAAFDIEAQAQARAAVDTGYLRNAIYANGGGSDWRVDSPADYSVFQEFGTRHMPAHPYLVPALEHVRPVLLALLRRIA